MNIPWPMPSALRKWPIFGNIYFAFYLEGSMATSSTTLKRLKVAAAKAAARAAAAKEQVQSAKAQLKQARKLLKIEKKASKQARRKMDAAAATAAPGRPPKPAAVARAAVAKPSKSVAAPKPARTASRSVPKRRVRKSPQTLRSAAEVAKSVIERLHSPPPVLPPEPNIPADAAPALPSDPGHTPTGS
jgi:hypothetical protein